MRYGRIARVVGEAFDADQIDDWRCEECGRDQYGCACEPEEGEEENGGEA